MEKSVIKTEYLSKVYTTGFLKRKIRALDNLNLEVKQGEIFGFLGPNAAGKTTTIKILMGLLYPTVGNAYIFGKRIGNHKSKEDIGYLPENPSFYHHLTGFELLNFYGTVFGLPKQIKKERIRHLMETVGLSDASNLRLGKYSKGMNQRIGIAQALVNDPQLLVLDEPLSGLDPLGRKSLRDLILRLKEDGKTIFFSSHILADVEMICDRVGILINGKLLSVGRLERILKEEVESIEITAKIPQRIMDKVIKVASKVVRSGDKTMVIVNREKDSDTVQNIIGRAKGRVISIIPRTKTLEEHFIGEIRRMG